MKEYFIVVDKENEEDRLVRSDGAFLVLPANTLLPWAKENKIKLTKEDVAPPNLEFVMGPTEEQAALVEARFPVAPEPPKDPVADLSLDERVKLYLAQVPVEDSPEIEETEGHPT